MWATQCRGSSYVYCIRVFSRGHIFCSLRLDCDYLSNRFLMSIRRVFATTIYTDANYKYGDMVNFTLHFASVKSTISPNEEGSSIT